MGPCKSKSEKKTHENADIIKKSSIDIKTTDLPKLSEASHLLSVAAECSRKNDFENAIENNIKAVEIYKGISFNSHLHGGALNSLGGAYNNAKQWNEAEKVLLEAYKILEKYPNRSAELDQIKGNLRETYLGLGDTEKAKKYS